MVVVVRDNPCDTDRVTCAARCSTLSGVPTCLDFKVYAGDSFAVRFRFVYQGTTDPFPVPGLWLSNVRRSPRDVLALTSFAIDDSDEDPGGIIGISLTGEQTAALPQDVALVWDLQYLPEGGSQPHTWFRGDLISTRDVSR